MTTSPSSLDSIFCAAVDLASSAERAAYIAKACGDDQDLRAQVERLVAAHFRAGSFMEKPLASEAATLVPPGAAAAPLHAPHSAATEGSGTRFGPYKLLQQIGEGGMGVVWMAEQAEPMRRTVALKVIKAGMDSGQVVARFEAERQALALMDHPNIAKVLDAGSTAGGRPYFVMELVKGTPITKYCDEHRLTIRQRLELFVPVCRALQHAHQKGIIHRDIKPSNVLIAPYDGKPVVKVIDFGVAKATGQRLTERTMFTEFGAIVGTLQYMSPEQAELNNQDIDTRSDIYSLGVLLYELLTGTTPLDMKRLRGTAFAAILMLIQEEEPPKPSTRLSDSKESLASMSAQRQTDPAQMAKLLRGDLDWIVMRALNKDRGRRYESASGLARDIERYLNEELVEACPPSTSYRLGKFFRRNRGPVVAAGLVLLALVAGIAGTTFGLIRAQEARSAEFERAEGERFAKLEAEAKRADAEAQRERAEKSEMLASVQLVELKKEKISSDRRAASVKLSNIADEVRDAGRLREAIALYEQVGDSQAKHLGADHEETLSTFRNLAIAYRTAGKLKEAIGLLERVRDAEVKTLGFNHPTTLATQQDLASAYMIGGKLKEAIGLLEPVRDVQRKQLGEDRKTFPKDSPQLAYKLTEYGATLLLIKADADAEPLLREGLAIHEKTGPDQWVTFYAQSLLGAALLGQKRYTEAEPFLLKGYEGMKQREWAIPSRSKEFLTQGLERLVQLYTTMQKRDEAAKWRRLLAAQKQAGGSLK